MSPLLMPIFSKDFTKALYTYEDDHFYLFHVVHVNTETSQVNIYKVMETSLGFNTEALLESDLFELFNAGDIELIGSSNYELLAEMSDRMLKELAMSSHVHTEIMKSVTGTFGHGEFHEN